MADPFQNGGREFVFIVGCPRSGTTWLQSLVASHPKVRTGPESHVFHWYLGPMIRRMNAELQNKDVGLGNYFTEEEMRGVFRDFARQLLDPMTRRLEDGELFLEKTPDNSYLMGEISELLPRSKFIHMVRDGRDVAASILAASEGWAKDWAPSTCAGAARMWTKSVTAVRESASRISPERFHEVRYEELWADSPRVLSGVIRFLGLEWDEEGMTDAIRRNDASGTLEEHTTFERRGAYARAHGPSTVKSDFIRSPAPGGWRKNLGPADKIRFWMVARKVMGEMGYPCLYPW